MSDPRTGFPKLDEKGVSLIIILGVVAIIVTISLAAISRSVIDVRISKQEEEQARAFSVAELGLERAIVGGDLVGTEDEIQYHVAPDVIIPTPIPSSTFQGLVFPRNYSQGEIATIWLVGHNPDGSFNTNNRFNDDRLFIHWQSEHSTDSTSVEAVLYYQDGSGNFHTRRFPISPNGQPNDFFNAGNSQVLDGFDYQFRLGTAASPLPCISQTCYALRVRFLTNTQLQPLGVRARRRRGVATAIIFPSQGNSFKSTASVVSSGVTSVLRRYILYEDFPTFLDFAVYSYEDLVKP